MKSSPILGIRSHLSRINEKHTQKEVVYKYSNLLKSYDLREYKKLLAQLDVIIRGNMVCTPLFRVETARLNRGYIQVDKIGKYIKKNSEI